ncbi:MAG: Thiamine-phosphate synthase [Clostridia bacterium 41_269]|nr:MAG: Thiamine-phosphate synthase [Clostridia bacterium 41_269]
MALTDLGVYLVTGQELSVGRSTLEVVTKAVEGGINTVQLREKNMSTRELVALGKEVRRITKEYGVILIINDRVDVAMAVEADGVHLGQDDFPIEDARRLLGEDAIIGLSVDNAEEAAFAEELGVDYVGLGPIFKTSTKTDTGPLVGPEGIAEVVEKINIPVVAIGGINKHNAADVLKAGAHSIAVVTAITKAEDITKETRELVEIFKRYRR